MKKMIAWLHRMPVLSMLWIAICYAMGAGAWLSWWYQLTPGLDSVTSDLVSMVIGYLLQAGGVWFSVAMLRKKGEKDLLPWVLGVILLFMLSSALSLLSQSLASTLFWGLLMNLVDGILAGLYLYTIFVHSENHMHGFLFGCGYALLTPLMYFLALVGNGSFFRRDAALWMYLGMAALACVLAYPLFSGKRATVVTDQHQKAAFNASRESTPLIAASEKAGIVAESVKSGLPAMALLVLFLFSVVKNLGFSFPSTDIITGTTVELSRLFYGLGLVAAGWIHSRSPKASAICAMISLVISFVMLAMEGEPILRVAFWALDYFFFAFVSVYRMALPMDLAKSHIAQAIPLALAGLLVGRIGDAVGTLLCVSLSGSKLWLILLTLVLFVVTIFLFFRLYLALYLPEQQKERSEREVFTDFSIQHDLSDREKEVLRLLLSGQSNGQIAESLFVTESTVKFHVHNLLQKTGCKTRRELTEKFHMLLFPQITKKPPAE